MLGKRENAQKESTGGGATLKFPHQLAVTSQILTASAEACLIVYREKMV